MLTDDEKRQMYDQVGHERFQQSQKRGGGGGGRGQGNPFGGGGNPFGGMGGGGGGFEDIFNNLFNGGAGGQQRNRPQQGRDVAQRISIDLEDAYHGVERDVTIRRREVCPECDGEGHPEDADVNTCSECNGSGQQTTVQQTPFGRVQQTTTCRACGGEGETYSEDCSECRGSGRVRRTRDVTITIPAGFRDGQRLRYRGEGEPGENGGPNGDLFVEVNVRDHDEFDRDGDDLRYTHPISFPQAVFGATVEVPTLDGEEELKVPAGTQSGSTFTVSGAGMPHLDGPWQRRPARRGPRRHARGPQQRAARGAQRVRRGRRRGGQRGPLPEAEELAVSDFRHRHALVCGGRRFGRCPTRKRTTRT